MSDGADKNAPVDPPVISTDNNPPVADPPAGAPPAGTPPGTALDPPAEPPAVGAPPPNWPEDWRQKLAGEDKAYLKTLERFPDPTALAKSYRELSQKLGSREIVPTLKPDATEAETKEYRKAVGLPETPDAYQVKLPDGVVLGDDDKAVINDFKAVAHTANMTEAQLSSMVGKYYEFIDAKNLQQYEQDKEAEAVASAALRQEWGTTFTPEVKNLKTFMATQFGQQLGNEIGMARLPDGRLLGNITEYVQKMAEIARTIQPFGTLVPAGSGDAVKAGEARIAEIEKYMRDNNEGYRKDANMQSELLQLYEARIAHNRSNAA